MTTMLRGQGRRRGRRTQQERVQATRSKLINATIECIIEAGYGGATLPEISRRAGVSIGGVQHHFESKTDLIFAAINHVFTEMHAFLTELPHNSESLDVRIDHILHQYWAWFSSPTYLAAWELMIGARQDAELLAMVRERIAVGREEIHYLWREAFADVEISDEELEDVIGYVFSTMRGMALTKIFTAQNTKYERMLEFLREFLRHSLAAPAQEKPAGESGSPGQV